jgi:alpha-tubulin suppressor-like RCC1 family protein
VASEPYLHRKLMGGRVYSFGQNKRGCLGQGNTLQTEHLRPRPVRGLIESEAVLSVAAGDLHTLVLMRSGKVYSFGCGLFGKLGHGFGQCEFFPRYGDRAHMRTHARTNTLHRTHTYTCTHTLHRTHARTVTRACTIIARTHTHTHTGTNG